MTQEARMNVAMLYQQKWQILSAIEESGTLDALRAIEIAFRMADFSRSGRVESRHGMP